ncbi:MAG: hypothetical protein IKB93_06435 [Clostridia bacterium]|nr:hypothetical protein [Clostridia bacterium]
MKKKKYEAPTIYVTEIETEDIILTSGLLGSEILERNEILGHGTIDYYNMIGIDLD